MKTKHAKSRIGLGAGTPSTPNPFRFVIGVACLLAGWAEGAVTLESQWRHLPEVTTKPEATPKAQETNVSGGNKWADAAQSPDTVPVKFHCEFRAADCSVSISLAGRSVTCDDPLYSGDGLFTTEEATVNLEPYKTYELRMTGDNVYNADAILTPPSLHSLFASPTVAQRPARLYSAYWWNNDTQAWQKICPYTGPHWGVDSWGPMDAKFLVQIRPDLGARPVTKPGTKAVTGEDQADDAWTRDEPAIDTSTAPGDGEAVTMVASKQGDPASVRFSWAAHMGRLWTGAGAGRIRLSELGFTSNSYTPRILNYAARSTDTNEVTVVMDLDDTNCLSQVKAPQALADIEVLYGAAHFSTNDLIGVCSLVAAMTNHSDLLSGYLWSNLSAQAQAILAATNATFQQAQYILLTNFNGLIQAGPLYETNRFAPVSLSGRTRRLLLRNPQSGDLLVRLNRFLLEDAYPQGLARLRSSRFDLRFYIAALVGPQDALGFFTVAPNATPFVIWRMGLPDGASNRWELQEIRNGTTNTTLLAYGPSAGVWTLTRGTGGEARVETRTITTNTVSGVTRAVETVEITNGAGTVCDRVVEVFQKFDWGYELVTVTNDPGGANLVTSFTFNTATNSVFEEAAYGKIASIVYPDGFWERREYSPALDWGSSPLQAEFGALVRVVQPWQDSPITAASPDCLVTDYDYVPYSPGSYRLVKWHDPDGTRASYAVEDYIRLIERGDFPAVYTEVVTVVQDPCYSPLDVTELRTVGCLQGYGEHQETRYFNPFAGHLAGQLFHKTLDYGRADSYDYEFGAWNWESLTFSRNQDPLTPDPMVGTDLRHTIFHGFHNSLATHEELLISGPSGGPFQPLGMEPYRATKEVRIMCGGNLVAKELYVYEGCDEQSCPVFALTDQVIYERDCLGHATNVVRIDPATHQERVIYRADWTGGAAWPGDLKLSETDETGICHTYTYDSLKRVKTLTKQPAAGQAAIVTTLAYDAANRVLTNTVTAGPLALSTTAHYDLAGRKTNETDAAGLTTTYSYQDGGRQTTVTHSSGTTMVIRKYLDRRVASITGSAVTNQFFFYSVDPHRVILGNHECAAKRDHGSLRFQQLAALDRHTHRQEGPGHSPSKTRLRPYQRAFHKLEA